LGGSDAEPPGGRTGSGLRGTMQACQSRSNCRSSSFDAMAREWVLHNEKISSVPIETIANPNYLVVHRL